MLAVHVHARVRPERVADFLAATQVNAHASLAEPRASTKFSVVFPAASEGWAAPAP